MVAANGAKTLYTRIFRISRHCENQFCVFRIALFWTFKTVYCGNILFTQIRTLCFNFSHFRFSRCGERVIFRKIWMATERFFQLNRTTNRHHKHSVFTLTIYIIFLGWNDYNSMQFGYCLRLAFDWGDCLHCAVPLADYCKYFRTKRFWNIACMKALLKCIWVYRNNVRFACKPLLVLGLNLSPFLLNESVSLAFCLRAYWNIWSVIKYVVLISCKFSTKETINSIYYVTE